MRRWTKANEMVLDYVSIHAPTWGATIHHFCHIEYSRFQSTHPRGVRHLNRIFTGVPNLFQSTHPRGVRLPIPCPDILPCGVSIHAPTWGATFLLLRWLEIIPFQSTHPRGVRPSSLRTDCSFINCFNPRTHVGCDLKPSTQLSIRRLFQSTHPRGVRRLTVGAMVAYKRVSIHAPTWGATQPAVDVRKGACVSIHAPTWGATSKADDMVPYGSGFNPRTHVGCDQC